MLDAHWAVNTRSAILLAQAFAARHDGRPGGRVIFMTSGQDLGPMTGEIAYAASKGALASITRTLADHLADQAITLNTVNPGPVDTGYATPEAREMVRRHFPPGKVGHPRRPGPPDRLAGHRRSRLDHRADHQHRRRLPPLRLTSKQQPERKAFRQLRYLSPPEHGQRDRMGQGRTAAGRRADRRLEGLI